MISVESYIGTMMIVVGFMGAMIIVRIRGNAVMSQRRMYRMMLSCGVSEAAARNPDELLDIDMHDVRRRCRQCPAPDKCDRWLNGETVPGNDFCPNVALFMAAADANQCRVRYEPSRRPGRRLD